MFSNKSDKPLTARQKSIREAKQTHNKYAKLYAEDKKRRQNESGNLGRWTDNYPLTGKPDPLQVLVDPIVNNRIFQAIVFILIIISVYSLYMTYLAESPIDMEEYTTYSFYISIIFMVEFGLKFASRRWAYFRREGIVDFLAATDIFTPAIRALKFARFLRFLRMLRVLRVVRGARMAKKGSTVIENSLFTTFTTATIITMLGFIAIYTITNWNERKLRAHQSLKPLLSTVEQTLNINSDGTVASDVDRKKAEAMLARQPGFVRAKLFSSVFSYENKSKPWFYAVRKQVVSGSMSKAYSMFANVVKSRSNDIPLEKRLVFENQLLPLLGENSGIEEYEKLQNLLYMEKQDALSMEMPYLNLQAYMTVLDQLTKVIGVVQVKIDKIEEESTFINYLSTLHSKFFVDEFMPIRHSLGDAGDIEYIFLISDEYRQMRRDEMWMITATIILLVVMVIALNFAASGIVRPLIELHGRILEIKETGKFAPIRFSIPPDNEFADIAESINAVIKRLLVGNKDSIDTFR